MKKLVSLIIVLLVVALSLVALVGCQSAQEINAIVAIDGQGNEMQEGVIYDMPSSLVFTSLNGPSNASPGGLVALATLRLSATVIPNTAINKKVDWVVEWASPDSAFATGKNVLEYINVIPDADGSNLVTVECYQTFSTDYIIVKVITRDGGYSATCTVSIDYSAYSMKLENGGVNYASMDTVELCAGDTYAFDPVFFTKLGFVASCSSNLEITSITGEGKINVDKITINNGTVVSTVSDIVNINDYISEFVSASVVNNKIQITVFQDETTFYHNKEERTGVKLKYVSTYINPQNPLGTPNACWIGIAVKDTISGLTCYIKIDMVSVVTGVNLAPFSYQF